jgi:hypothetical protein
MMGRFSEVARKAPLAPEPFLVAGAVAQLERDELRAERLFVAAAQRDPRSVAARYLLADWYLRSGRTSKALFEMAVLARLMPVATSQFAPALAQFAQSAGAVPIIKAFFQTSPEFESPILYELAKSNRNANLIFTLWSGSAAKPAPDWRQQLVSNLIQEEQYAKAHQVWLRSTGQIGGEALFNPTFRKLDLPPPFNWTLSAQGGLAEPTGDGGLKVVYYGRQDAVLAEQMMVLRPGIYRLMMELAGTSSDQPSVKWTITCLPGNRSVSEIQLRASPGIARLGMTFTIAPSCGAQQLRLEGELGEFPRSAEFTIRRLQLTRLGDK